MVSSLRSPSMSAIPSEVGLRRPVVEYFVPYTLSACCETPKIDIRLTSPEATLNCRASVSEVVDHEVSSSSESFLQSTVNHLVLAQARLRLTYCRSQVRVMDEKFEALGHNRQARRLLSTMRGGYKRIFPGTA